MLKQLLNGNNGLLLILTLNKSTEFQTKIQWAFFFKFSSIHELKKLIYKIRLLDLRCDYEASLTFICCSSAGEQSCGCTVVMATTSPTRRHVTSR